MNPVIITSPNSFRDTFLFLKDLYEEGDDSYIRDVYDSLYKSSTHIPKFPIWVWLVYDGIICFKALPKNNKKMWMNWCNNLTNLQLQNIMSELVNMGFEPFAHVEKYDDKKIKMLKDSGFIIINTVKQYRTEFNYPKNFFYYDKDIILEWRS
jgi:hypothetical protein